MTDQKKTKVSLRSCDSYDENKIYDILRQELEAIGVGRDNIEGKRVAIKPNLVRKMDAAQAGTTHPSLIFAVGKLMKELGAQSVVIAESPGGAYNEHALSANYRVCGVEEVASRVGLTLNYTTTWQNVDFPDGVNSKCFNIIDPIAECDVIVNICKLKTHGMAMMSCAVKNYFGTVPGVEKFEMHARFPKPEDFCGMIVDLCKMHCDRKFTVNVVDAVVGMEGNGPTNGTPRRIGALLASRDPFALDHVCAQLIGFEGRVETVRISEERGLFQRDMIDIVGDSVESLRITDFKAPDSERRSALSTVTNAFDGRFIKLFEPRPAINRKKCVGCCECVRSCPQHTIFFDRKKKRPYIVYDKCIKCFCCQELCPEDAVKIKQNPIIKLIH